MTKMTTEYKVIFVVYATIQDMYDSTGCIVYSGTTHVWGIDIDNSIMFWGRVKEII